MLRINLLIILFFLFVSCKRSVDGVIQTTNNINIVFHDISNVGAPVKKGDYINSQLIVKDSNDSLVFNSDFNGLNGVSSFLYDSSMYNSSYSELFKNLIEGDRISFITTQREFSNCFFKYNDFDSDFIDQSIKVNFRFISSCDEENQITFKTKL